MPQANPGDTGTARLPPESPILPWALGVAQPGTPITGGGDSPGGESLNLDHPLPESSIRAHDPGFVTAAPSQAGDGPDCSDQEVGSYEVMSSPPLECCRGEAHR